MPDLDWDPARARALADGAAALWEEWLQKLPSLPVDPGLPREQIAARVRRDVPEEGLSDDAVLDYLRAVVFDASMYPGHPGFLAYISGAGTAPGAVAEFVAAAINQNLGGWRLAPGGTEIEIALIGWLCRMFGLPETGGGLMVSGGAMANFVALKTARDARAGSDVRRGGVGDQKLVFYASDESHVVIERAADMLGLGTASVRKIATASSGEMDVSALTKALDDDLAAGMRPCCVVATAGTTATGAIDPLPAIAEVAGHYGAWLHVDAAYGGAALLAPDLKALFQGIEQADSIAFDPHKWLYVPLTAGCVLVRDEATLHRAFNVEASYTYQDLEATKRGPDLAMFGPQFSRGFQALKVWISLLSHGTRAYAERISHDARLARYLGELVTDHEELELVAEPSLSICCFRFVPSDVIPGAGAEPYLNELNQTIMTALQTGSSSYCSNAVVAGRFALRACIVNFRTEATDIEELVQTSVEIGRRIHAERSPHERVES